MCFYVPHGRHDQGESWRGILVDRRLAAPRQISLSSVRVQLWAQNCKYYEILEINRPIGRIPSAIVIQCSGLRPTGYSMVVRSRNKTVCFVLSGN